MTLTLGIELDHITRKSLFMVDFSLLIASVDMMRYCKYICHHSKTWDFPYLTREQIWSQFSARKYYVFWKHTHVLFRSYFACISMYRKVILWEWNVYFIIVYIYLVKLINFFKKNYCRGYIDRVKLMEEVLHGIQILRHHEWGPQLNELQTLMQAQLGPSSRDASGTV